MDKERLVKFVWRLKTKKDGNERDIMNLMK